MKRIFILLVVITGLYIIFYRGFTFAWFSASSAKDTRAAVTSNTEKISIDVGSGSTLIIPEDRKDVKAVYKGDGKLSVKENGNTIEVTLKSKWFDWFNWTKRNDLKIYVPKDYDRSMSIDLGSGNFHFSGSKQVKLKDLRLEIGSGNMNINNLSVNKFSLDGASGNVKINKLKTDTGTIDLSSGNINIDHYAGALKTDVSSGKLNIQMDQLKDDVEIDVSSGLVDLNVPNNADFTLHGDVSSGKISCTLPLTSNGTGGKGISGKHGTGKYKINVDVSSGLVHIK
jgi:lia operon protein LiaG